MKEMFYVLEFVCLFVYLVSRSNETWYSVRKSAVLECLRFHIMALANF